VNVPTTPTDSHVGDDPRTIAVEQFVWRLQGLVVAEDRASLAHLRRAAGEWLGELPAKRRGPVLSLFYGKLLPDLAGRQEREEDFFLVATLFAIAQMGHDRSQPGSFRGNLGRALRFLKAAKDQLRTEAGASPMDRRVVALLDAPREALAFRLRQVVRILGTEHIGVDWALLLRDVMDWDRPNRQVQRRWARAYFGKRPATTNESREGETRSEETESQDEAAGAAKEKEE